MYTCGVEANTAACELISRRFPRSRIAAIYCATFRTGTIWVLAYEPTQASRVIDIRARKRSAPG